MGIPSYFRKIIKAYPNCITALPKKVSLLCFDFNCLIYRCLRSPSLPPYSQGGDKDAWEALLLKEVASCIKEVWITAGKPSQVFLGVDGVVPMAKIRQQRVRRFKSAWQREGGSWDSNAITPGSEFMEKLTRMLHKEAAKHGKGWVVSGSNESGEGEHKILSFLRAREEGKEDSIIVYGLDADLILLNMLISEEKKLSVYLLREKQEFGGVKADPTAAQEYSFLSIHELKGLVNVTDSISALNYVGLMTLMGNDFLPHSLTHKLSEDGHDFVIRELGKMKDSSNWLVDVRGGVSLHVLRSIFSKWASGEESRMEHMIHKKQEQATRGVLKGMNESEGLPLVWNIECSLLHKGRLRSNWRDIYWNLIQPDGNREQICEEYIRGFQWVLDYYTGKPVNKEWMYPSWLPPLWSDLEKIHTLPLLKGGEGVKEPEEEEQLAMVLPLSSWNLIRDPSLKSLPSKCPQMWPLKFEFFSAGRKWLWECEARIPVLTAGRLRYILKR
jgi:5'-3' exonuclease